eukprot:m.175771 g.175771  ORF g.175771 m.175771 type:complete len:50 (-) comp17354_c0_seq1:152-301(-)
MLAQQQDTRHVGLEGSHLLLLDGESVSPPDAAQPPHRHATCPLHSALWM